MAVELGVAPSVLENETPEMLQTIINYFNWREERKR